MRRHTLSINQRHILLFQSSSGRFFQSTTLCAYHISATVCSTISTTQWTASRISLPPTAPRSPLLRPFKDRVSTTRLHKATTTPGVIWSTTEASHEEVHILPSNSPSTQVNTASLDILPRATLLMHHLERPPQLALAVLVLFLALLLAVAAWISYSDLIGAEGFLLESISSEGYTLSNGMNHRAAQRRKQCTTEEAKLVQSWYKLSLPPIAK